MPRRKTHQFVVETRGLSDATAAELYRALTAVAFLAVGEEPGQEAQVCPTKGFTAEQRGTLPEFTFEKGPLLKVVQA